MSDVLMNDASNGAITTSQPDTQLIETSAVEVPLGLLAEITHRCPLQCLYCSNPLELEKPSQELSADEWARVFDEAAALGVVQVHISGGEPLARGDLIEIVRSASLAGLYVNLITAAVNLTPERADALVAAGVDHVQISLQDTTRDGAARITNSKNAFERKLSAARLVTERGLPLTINAVVHRQNLDRVEEMIEIAQMLGAHRLEIAHAQYYGWAYRNRSVLMPAPGQVEAATKAVSAAQERLRGRLLIDYVVPDYYAKYPKPCMGGWGRQFINVTPSGTVLPCHAAASIPGLAFETVRERDLASIWRDSAAFNRFRGTDWMAEPCRSCPRQKDDFGGCRCQARLLTGDAANADPVCTLSPFHDRVAHLATSFSSSAGGEFAYRRYS
jgi:pyrroloquinoline quinone biosynthesis protein E